MVSVNEVLLIAFTQNLRNLFYLFFREMRVLLLLLNAFLHLACFT